MEKSKLGIPLNLFAAMLFFLGAAGSILAVLIAAGYVLVFEENELLKRAAVKAIIIFVFMAILMSLISLLITFSSYIINAANAYLVYNSISIPSNYILQFVSLGVNHIIRIAEIIIYILLGFRAYKVIDIKIGVIDKLLEVER